MTDPHELLEAELSALRPPRVPTALRNRIAQRLRPSRFAGPHWRRAALVGGVPVACLVVLLLVRNGGRVEQAPQQPPAEVRSASPALIDGGRGDELPTLRAYRAALSRSLQDVERLLDRHARAASSGEGGAVQVVAFARLDELHPLTGDF